MISSATRVVMGEISKVLTTSQKKQVVLRMTERKKELNEDSQIVTEELLSELERGTPQGSVDVDGPLSAMREESLVANDPIGPEVLRALEELSTKALDEYPFIRVLRPSGTQYVLVGTLAGTSYKWGKVIADGALDDDVFRNSPLTKSYVKRKDGWTFKIHAFKYAEGLRMRFWVHVDDGKGNKGDHPGSRLFFVTRDLRVKQVDKYEYEALR